MDKNYLKILYNKLKKKINENSNSSYTKYLIENPNILRKKINEESFEVIEEIFKEDKKKVITESADLLYHLLVAWIYLKIKPQDVFKELENRESISGFEEKKRRNK